ncbi:tripartite tricarboxylate transporter substrate binding protein [Parapusillimonas granuli]|uniref:Tripartite tricarboxylate transporter substrate binding protein n=2 Tax=Parapusillimonas granuli TaxID=380911 RepID=A0A853FUL6_9BURK|nr:tripartite tricarboxylate transporter substrate binding protein [Parapusillimonas granuli]NYT49655.1 tripartite tricarboxylate transporter substrate binding protein [Parapusillimonas granuli]
MTATYAATVHANDYPSKPVTVIVPFAAGGTSDVVARTITQKLATEWGQPIVVETKPGANSAIGATALARSAPDGYTFLIGSIGTYAINPGLYKTLNYDPNKDFAYLSIAVRNANVLVAAPNFPANTVEELIAYAKKNPDSVSYATGGTGSSDHLSAVLFRQQTGTTGVDVPYKGGAAAQNDIMGNQVNVSFQNLGSVSNLIKSGRMKALAITAEKRSAQLPDVPTFAEAGVPGMVVYSWQAFAAPKATPDGILKRLSTGLQSAMKNTEVKEKLEGMGFEVMATTPEEALKFQQAEAARWAAIIQQNKISVD